MHWSELPNYLNGVLVIATLLVVLFAWQTVKEARKATDEESKTVAELQQLVRAARETAEIVSATRAADERHRQMEQLRAIHRLAVAVSRTLESGMRGGGGTPSTGWRCTEQDELAHALVGAVPQLPDCRKLAQTNGPDGIRPAFRAADRELKEVFRSLGAEGG